MNKNLLAGLLLLGSSCNAFAAGVDIALSDETAYVNLLLNPFGFGTYSYGYGGNCPQTTPSVTCDGGTEMMLGGMISEAGDQLAQASLMARSSRTTVGNSYDVAAGIKLIGGDIDFDERVEDPLVDNETVGALALGMEFGGVLVQSPSNPVDISVSAFYAPSITSFSDAERFMELSARLQIEVIPSALAYVGYRRLRFDTDAYDDVKLDSSTHLGLRISF